MIADFCASFEGRWRGLAGSVGEYLPSFFGNRRKALTSSVVSSLPMAAFVMLETATLFRVVPDLGSAAKAAAPFAEMPLINAPKKWLPPPEILQVFSTIFVLSCRRQPP